MRAVWALACAICVLVVVPNARAASATDPAPPGANDFSCRPSAAHPRPVVLVHGLTVGMSPAMWATMSPELRARGWCVFALNYGLDDRIPGVGGVRPIQDSAAELKTFVARVLAATGSSKVDLVGGSLGTFMPQYWLRELGGAPSVDRYVAIGSLYDGTTFTLFRALGPTCGACSQIEHGSDMVQLLRRGGIAAPGVHYTSITSRYDEIVTPASSSRIDGEGNANIVLQDVCPLNVSEHFLLTTDPDVLTLTVNALDPEHAERVACPGAKPPATTAPATGPGAAPTEAVRRAVGLRARRSIGLRTLRRTGLAVRLRAGVGGRYRLRLARGSRTLATASRTVAAGRRRTVRLRPSARARFPSGRSFVVRVVVTPPSGTAIVRQVRVRR